MSLDRAALRLATVMAITNGYAEPWPTIARGNVYDSRIDPIQGLKPGDMAPLAIVFTDDDDGAALSVNNGGPPWRRDVNLIVELSIGMAGELLDENQQPLKDENGAPLVDMVPIATEPELELTLDLFEHQLERLFEDVSGNPWTRRLFDQHIVRIESWSSKRFVEREGHMRLAARQIIAKVMLNQPQPVTAANTIPEPLGSLLGAIIAAAGSYAPSAQAMQDLLVGNGGFAPLNLPALTKVRLKEANLGGGNLTGTGPARPDGVGQAAIPQD